MYENETAKMSGRPINPIERVDSSAVRVTTPATINELVDDLFNLLSRFESTVDEHRKVITPALRSATTSPVAPPGYKDDSMPSGDSDLYMRLNNLGRLLDQQVRNLQELTGYVQL
jgi:hypothetical protein